MDFGDSSGEQPSDLKYGTTAIEQKAKDSTVVWQIVNEIMNFGVTQEQMLLVIKRLALNLENDDHMKRIAKVVDEIMRSGIEEPSALVLDV